MILSQNQKKQFWTDGFLLVGNAINDRQLENLKKTFLDWVNDSRNYKTDYGETMDGRPRFDLQPGHSSDVPGLRRIQSPEEISEVFADVMRNGRSVDMCAELIGQGIRFHHGKVNSKLPGTATKVNFHQDFPFEPMTNDDMITCLLFIDDVTLENGPLEVVPGTHKGPLYSHWHNGIFTGSVSDEILAQHEDKVMRCTGKAGSVCLMHASLLHGSAPNLSNKSRTLYISTYYAEDAVELSPNHLPSTLTHELVRGEASGRVRCSSYDMQLPEVPKGTSFFAQQASAEK